MIKDADFKLLNHRAKDFNKYKNGQNLAEGYKPDFVLKHEEKEEYIILESEVSSSRKTFIGGMVKAAHFFRNDKKGILIFVMEPKLNTSSKSIVKQLKTYYTWLRDITNLKAIYVITAKDYVDKDFPLEINGFEFRKRAYCIS